MRTTLHLIPKAAQQFWGMDKRSARDATFERATKMPEIELRPWQSEALAKAMKWLSPKNGQKHFLINAAPGAGKTICASIIARRLIETGQIDRVVVIAPRSEVVRQWADEYKFVTGRHMTKVTGADADVADYGLDVCATWAAVQGLLDGFQQICRTHKTLIICDEHHHAAVEAAWGKGAAGAFADAEMVLILTGTPIRSDGGDTVWLAYDDEGQIDYPQDGIYSLSYGEAVELAYCRPITFHRHEGRFSVSLPDGESIPVSGTEDVQLSPNLKRIKGLQQALDFYKLACTPKYLPNGEPDLNSYQASMLEWCIRKLDDIRDTIPSAGGLVIAPNIAVAEYMADLLERMEDQRPVLVHSQQPNAEAKIAAFRNTDRRWIVSVAMISEGVDIKRLRILAYLPYAQTELAFRQAMGRVVRTLGKDDYSRAYVVMPTHRVLEEYARRVELEMSATHRKDASEQITKQCPSCGAENLKSASTCVECGHEFPAKIANMKPCEECGALNPISAGECQNCGISFRQEFEVTLNEALRLGAIIRGMDLDEEEVREGEANKNEIRDAVLKSGDDAIIRILKQLPEESWGRLRRIMNSDG